MQPYCNQFTTAIRSPEARWRRTSPNPGWCAGLASLAMSPRGLTSTPRAGGGSSTSAGFRDAQPPTAMIRMSEDEPHTPAVAKPMARAAVASCALWVTSTGATERPSRHRTAVARWIASSVPSGVGNGSAALRSTAGDTSTRSMRSTSGWNNTTRRRTEESTYAITIALRVPREVDPRRRPPSGWDREAEHPEARRAQGG